MGALIFVLALAVPAALRAQIVWGSPVVISGDADALTNGLTLCAFDWKNTTATVNGITFTGTSSTSSAGTNVVLGGFSADYTGYGSASSPFGALSAAYQNVLGGGVYVNGATATVTLINLIAGHQYAVQVWVNDSRGPENGRTETVIGGGNMPTLDYSSASGTSPGGVGQYAIGVFTATDTSQPFTLTGSASTQLNALLLANVTGTGFQPVNPPPLTARAGWVHFNNAQTALVYSNDNMGNRLPDFSYAGYEGGGVAIPTNVPVATNINAIAGDNTAQIQAAINYVSGLTPDTYGFRGAVLFNPGTYQIAGTLTVSAGGVILRGSGNNTNTGTVLLVTGDARNVITVGGSGSWTQTNGIYTITDNYVPLGATSFHVGNGSSIVWGTNVTVSADTDVFTNGTLLYAYDWSGTNVTVNGVSFTGISSVNASTNVSVTGIGGPYQNFTSSQSPFGALSAAYRGVLVGGDYGGAVSATVTLNNLTVGRVYAVQAWVSDPRGGGVAGRTETVAGSNIVTLAYNVPAAAGGVGQYTIGVFTATATSELFSLSSTNSTQLNALLVSDVTATGYRPANPPPQTPALTLAVGDTIIVQRPQTQPWINAIDMNALTNPWTPGNGLEFECQVTAINGNQISVDVPLCNPIEQTWTMGQVFQVTDASRIQQVGMENLCGVGQIADYPSNILTGTFVVYQNLKNGWFRNVLMSGWGNGVSLNGGVKWFTAQDCQYVNPATGTSSAAPAAYTIGSSCSRCLMQRCAADGPYYHIMVTQAGTPGPDVFLNFMCSGTHYNGGPHQRWAAGALHDNIVMAPDSVGGYTPYLAINNRGNDGSGQGWAAGFSLMYNCQVPQFQLEQPDTTTNHYNWTIGGIGSAYAYSDNGIYDTKGSMVSPHSLYLEQLRERLGGAAVENIGYPLFTIASAPSSQTLAPGTNATFAVTIGDPTLMDTSVALSVNGLPANLTASFNTNTVTGAGSATLTVTASSAVTPGSYTLNVTGANDGLTHTSSVSLFVLGTPSLNPVATGHAGTFAFSFSGPNGQTYHILCSTNLALPWTQWSVVTNGVFGSGPSYFTNPATTNSRMYYRVKSP